MTAPGRVSRLSVGSWLVYDLANTIFALGVIGLYFPDWLKQVGQPDSALAIVEAGAGARATSARRWATALGRDLNHPAKAVFGTSPSTGVTRCWRPGASLNTMASPDPVLGTSASIRRVPRSRSWSTPPV